MAVELSQIIIAGIKFIRYGVLLVAGKIFDAILFVEPVKRAYRDKRCNLNRRFNTDGIGYQIPGVVIKAVITANDKPVPDKETAPHC